MKFRKIALTALIAFALAACMGLAACGPKDEGPQNTPVPTDLPETTDTITVTNQAAAFLGVYTKLAGDPNWGDKKLTGIENGMSAEANMNEICQYGPGVYDIGTIDENERNYDFYNVEVAGNDQLTVSFQGNNVPCELNVLHADGSSTTYYGRSYLNGSEIMVTSGYETSAMDAFYFVLPSAERWGSKLNYWGGQQPGTTATIAVEKLPYGECVYDLGFHDYSWPHWSEFYDIQVQAGDELIPWCEGGENKTSGVLGHAYLRIIHADGTEEVIEGVRNEGEAYRHSFE